MWGSEEAEGVDASCGGVSSSCCVGVCVRDCAGVLKTSSSGRATVDSGPSFWSEVVEDDARGEASGDLVAWRDGDCGGSGGGDDDEVGDVGDVGGGGAGTSSFESPMVRVL